MKNIQKLQQFFASMPDLKKTVLNNYHRTVINGKMINFAGYDMPVQYKDIGILNEHLHCREQTSIFDVSHMGQIKIKGNDSLEFLEKLVVGNIRDIPNKNGSLSLILNENAGIIDDTIVSKSGDHYHMVVNGGNKERDLEHMKKIQDQYFTGKDIRIEYLDDYQLLALQGPKAINVMQRIVGHDFNDLKFMQHQSYNVKDLGIEVTVFRCGYTGEDGFEISVKSEDVEKLFDLFISQPEVKPAGLGARDSLRTEAGLCLHGNDMSEDTTPAECSLMWTVRKNDQGSVNFVGRDALTKQRKEGVSQRRVGFVMTSKGIIRPPAEVFNSDGEKIGKVSSGVYSPMLKNGIGMCFIDPKYIKAGTDIVIKMRNKEYSAQVSKMPFVPAHYVK